MKRLGYVVLAALLLLVAPLNVNAQVGMDEGVKVTVLSTPKFTNMTVYMYDSAASKLDAVNTSYVQVLDYTLKDLDASDSYQPAVALNLDAPTVDNTTNESVAYAYILRYASGDAAVFAVADVNTTDNTITSMDYYKISPVSGDIAVLRTSSDIVIEGYGYKLSIPLANHTNPTIMLMADSGATVQVDEVDYVELRALNGVPSGYTLVRSGNGEAEFTVSASGTLYVWFDESHQGGDVDLFVFDSSNEYFSQAGTSSTWGWLAWHCDRYLFADAYPQSNHLEASGTVKFIVKRYSGDASAVNWEVATRLASGTSTTTPADTTTQTETGTGSPGGLSARIQDALGGGGNGVVYAAALLVFLLLLLALLRR